MSGMNRWLIALLLTVATSSASATPLTYLQKNAVPITSFDLNASLNDLEPLAGLVGEARIVAMGEATHGTAEFTQIRARMLEYLVERKGFTVFALETSWAGARDLNAYVQGGMGDAKALLTRYARLSWPWRTTQMLIVLEWMRTYNATASSKLRFTGFDLQDPVSAVDWVTAYLEAHAADQVSRSEDLLGCIRFSLSNTLGVARYAARGLDGSKLCAGNIRTVRQILENRRAALIARSSDLEYIEVLHASDMLTQENAYLEARLLRVDVDANAVRDRAMADNIAWLEKSYGQKIVVWAHNGHVTFTPDMTFGWKPFGAYLRERYGLGYLAIASSFAGGSFNAQLVGTDLVRSLTTAALGLTANPTEQHLPAPISGSYEQIFNSSGLETFLLPLRVSRNADSQWLWQPRTFYIVPQALPSFETPTPDWYSYTATLPLEFDALVFTKTSTPTTLLAIGF